MNPNYKHWDKCQRCPKHLCKIRHNENVLVSSIPFTGVYDWHIEAPCNYNVLSDCHDKNIVLHFSLVLFRRDRLHKPNFKSIQEVFDYMLATAKNLEEAISVTKIRKQLEV